MSNSIPTLCTDRSRPPPLRRPFRDNAHPQFRQNGHPGFYGNHMNPNMQALGNANWSEQVRPMGLIKKYPNYEPFHPPPQENFEYPQHMHPPHKRPRGPNDMEADRRRRHSSSEDRDDRPTRNGYHRSRSSDHRRRRSHSSDRSNRRRSHSSDRGHHGDNRRRKSSSRERRSRSSSRRHDRRSGSRGGRETSRRHDSPNSDSDLNSDNESRKGGGGSDSEERTSADKKPMSDYWTKSDSADDSELELESPVEHLKFSLHNRKELLRQSLRALKGKRLTAMIPPLLKNMGHGELEKKCLDVLEGLSKETVISILNGKFAGMFDKKPGVQETPKDMFKSLQEQAAPTDKDEGVTEMKKKKAKKKKKVEEELRDHENKTKSPKKKSQKKEGKEGEKKWKKKGVDGSKGVDESKVKKKKHKKDKSKKKRRKDERNETGGSMGGHQSLMELLELEFRAKAIKALLKTQGILGADVDAALVPETDESRPSPGPPPLPKTQSPKLVGNMTGETDIGDENKLNKTQLHKDKRLQAKGISENVVPKVSTSLNALDRVSSDESESESDGEEDEDEEISNDEEDDGVRRRKDVIDLVDEALAGGFDDTSLDLTGPDDEDNNRKSVVMLETPQILLDSAGAAAVDGVSELDGDKLRSKLLRNYRKRARKAKKNVLEAAEAEDVLELHAQDSSSNSNSSTDLSDDDDKVSEPEERDPHPNLSSDDVDQQPQPQEEPPQDTEATDLDKGSAQVGESIDSNEEEILSEEEAVEPEEAEEGEIRSGDEADDVSNHSQNLPASPAKDEVEDAERDPSSNKQEVSCDERRPRSRSSRSWRKERNEDSGKSEDDSNDAYPTPLTRTRLEEESKKTEPTRDLDSVDDDSLATRRPQSPVEYIRTFETDPISDSSSSEHSGNESKASKREKKISKSRNNLIEKYVSPSTKESAAAVDEPVEPAEISGVENQPVEPTEIPTVENRPVGADDEEEEPTPITWYERWFQSGSMQKVVQANKIQKNLRTKLKKSKKSRIVVVPTKEAPNLDKNAAASEPIIGSIEEYEKLFGKKVPPPPPEDKGEIETASGQTETSQGNGATSESSRPPEEEEDADLWGDIIGDDDD